MYMHNTIFITESP